MWCAFAPVSKEASNGTALRSVRRLIRSSSQRWTGARTSRSSEISRFLRRGGLFLGNENPFADIFDPADKAKGWLTAFDAETGKVRWKYPAPHPMLAGVTPTAGGLVFAADLGGQIYAMDAETGKILWQTDAGQSTGVALSLIAPEDDSSSAWLPE